MDEPTAGVDHASQEALAAVLHRLADRGTSMLIVTHELAALEARRQPHRLPRLPGTSTSTATPPRTPRTSPRHSAGSGHHHPDDRGAAAGHVIGAAPLDPAPREVSS